MDFTPSGTIDVEPRSFVTLASPQADAASLDEPERERPDQPGFVHKTADPTVFIEQAGTIAYHGPAELKVMGADVKLRSSSNESEYRTEDISSEGPAHERVWRWLVIEFDAGEITITSDAAPFQIAAQSATVDFDGAASFVAASGNVRIDGVNHAAESGRATTIDGRLSASLLPTANGDGFAIGLQGDARSVSLGATRIAVPQSAVSVPWDWIVLGLVGLVVVSGSAALLVVKKRQGPRERPAPRARARFTPEAWPRPDIFPAPPPLLIGGRDTENAMRANEAARLAHEAADQSQWTVAADLMTKARMDQDRPDLAYWHGWCLLRGGQWKAALAALEAAAEGLDTGEPERLAAWCVMGQMREHLSALDREYQAERPSAAIVHALGELEEEGAFYLARALDRAKRPGLVEEIAADKEFRDNLWSCAVDAALDRARNRFVVRSG